MDYDSDEGRMTAAEQLTAHDPRAAAEALRAIACDDGVGDEVRLSAAELLPAVDPQAAAEAFRGIPGDRLRHGPPPPPSPPRPPRPPW